MEQKNANVATMLAEEFLEQNYEFRRNVLRGTVEYRKLNSESAQWTMLTDEALKSIFIHCKRELGEKNDVRNDIRTYVESEEPQLYNPVSEWLMSLPEWDGTDRLMHLWNSIPGLSVEMVYFLCIWHRSVVAHWLNLDTEHGNECVPIVIGDQGVGKTTLCKRFLPPHLRQYFLDHFNLANKFDKEMALTNCLLVCLDELDQYSARQMSVIKQTLSKTEVNARTIFGRNIVTRQRFASFLATTNNRRPLTDPSGSRRFLCIEVPDGQYIDNSSVVDYDQLYAQICHELMVKGERYWFTNEEVKRIQELNAIYERAQDLEQIISLHYRKPAENEPFEEVTPADIHQMLCKEYPYLTQTVCSPYRIGRVMKSMGFGKRKTNKGVVYKVA